MMACKWRKELWATRLRLEEINIFLEEDLYNVILQEDTAKLETFVGKGEDYIARGG